MALFDVVSLIRRRLVASLRPAPANWAPFEEEIELVDEEDGRQQQAFILFKALAMGRMD